MYEIQRVFRSGQLAITRVLIYGTLGLQKEIPHAILF